MLEDHIQQAIAYWTAVNDPAKRGTPEQEAAKTVAEENGLFVYTDNGSWCERSAEKVASAFGWKAAREGVITAYEAREAILAALNAVRGAIDKALAVEAVAREAARDVERAREAEEHARVYKLSNAMADGKLLPASLHWLRRYGYKGDMSDIEAVIAWFRENPHADSLYNG